MAQLVSQNLVVAGGAVETYAQNSDHSIVAGLLIGLFEGGVYFEPSVTNHGEMHLDLAGFAVGTLLHFSATLAWNSGRVDNYGLMSAVDPTASSVRVLFGPGEMPRVMNAGTIDALAKGEAIGYWTGDSGAFLENVASGTIQAKAEDRAVAVYLQSGGTVSNNGNLLAEVFGGGNPAVTPAAYGIQLGLGELFATSNIFTNGLIEAKDNDPSAFLSEAISIHGEGPVTILNDGIIRGDYAIRKLSDPGASQHYQVKINNSGLIEGRVDLGAGDDLLINRDSIVGDVDMGAGADLYRGETGTLAGSVDGGDGDDRLGGGAGAETLLGGNGNDIIEGGGGADTIDGGAGADSFVYRFAADSTDSVRDRIRSFESGADLIDLRAMRVDSLTLSEHVDPDDGSIYTLVAIVSAGAVADMSIRVDAHLSLADFLLPPTPIAGSAGDDTIAGTAGGDSLLGEAGNDSLHGLGGNDRLDGADGDDILEGGAGDDFLVGGHGNGDVAIFSGNRADYDIDTVGHLTIRDLNPADGDDGTDILYGIELARFADSTTQLGIDPNNKPQLGQPAMQDQNWLDGVARSYQIPGTAFLDLDANDVLVFRAALSNGDPLPSWLSFDPSTRTFSGTPPVEVIGTTLEIRVRANDTGYIIFDDFLLSVTQAPGANIVGTDFADILSGTFRDETMIGLDGDDILRGSAGVDRLDGNSGTDEADYSGSPGGVTIDLPTRFGHGGDAEGDDLISIERVRGSAYDDFITGDAGQNRLDGGAGSDRLDGAAGADLLLGGSGDDLLIGGADQDTLDGGVGADAMAGGLGNDIYLVDNDGDLVTELAGEGSDEVRTSLASYTLTAEVETLRGVSGAGQTLIGNAGGNSIFGADGNDILAGAGGADQMRGGLGDDIYYVDDAGDTVIEFAGFGVDEIRTDLASYSLAALGDVERLTGLGALDQQLTGNDSDNIINGGAGADTMAGGYGNDLYYVDNGADVVIEHSDQGNDTIGTSLASYSLGAIANVENLTGLGSGDQTLSGNGLDNIINGGAGADTMTGGLGNDLYYVDNGGDVVVELAGEGNDTIGTSLTNYDLGALPQIENLIAATDNSHNFAGNAGNNLLQGGAGNDILNLRAGGIDNAIGGGGNDVIHFGAALTGADSVDGGSGIDQVVLQGDYSGGMILGGGFVSVESLAILPGSDARFGDTAGNFYDYNLATVEANVAAGMTMVVDANRLRLGEDFTFNGSAETDGAFFLYGGGGTDTFLGGSKNDTFYFGENNQFGATDHVDGGAGGTDQLGLRGSYTIVFGATQLVSIESLGLVSAQDTRFGALGTSYNYNLTMNDGNVAAGVRMTVDAAPLRGSETFTFDGSAETDGSFRIFGGQGTDTIKGSQSNDLITGGLGSDSLTGGGGADIFLYRTVADSLSTAGDMIHDFSTGDRIDLSQIDAVSGGANDAFTFIGSVAFSNTAGELRAVFQNNAWTVQGDVNGDGIADIEMVVISDHPLAGADFTL